MTSTCVLRKSQGKAETVSLRSRAGKKALFFSNRRFRWWGHSVGHLRTATSSSAMRRRVSVKALTILR